MTKFTTLELNRKDSFPVGQKTISFAKTGASCISKALAKSMSVKEGNHISFGKDENGNSYLFKQIGKKENSVMLRKNARGTIYFSSKEVARSVGGVTSKTGSKSKTTRFEAINSNLKHENSFMFKLIRL